MVEIPQSLVDDAIEDEGLCSIGKKYPLFFYWNRDIHRVQRLRVQLKSGGKNHMAFERECYENSPE